MKIVILTRMKYQERK